MSEDTTPILCNALLEKFRCFICNNYLSCSPIRVMADGNVICGICTPINSKIPVYPVLPLEEFLNEMNFPCRFKEYGCATLFPFGKAVAHELKCLYRSFVCPSLTSCTWKGSALQLYSHFADQHADLKKKNSEFKIKPDEGAHKVFVVMKGGNIFIVKYLYCSIEGSLKYDIRYIARGGCSCKATCKLYMANNVESEYCVNLKPTECAAFDEDFSIMHKETVLDLSKYSPALDDPTCIKITLSLKLTKCNNCVDLIAATNCDAVSKYASTSAYTP